MNLRKTCEAALANGCFKLVLRAGILQVLERLLGGSNERTESFRLMDRHIGENLAVDFDASLGQAVDEAAVGQAGFADGSIFQRMCSSGR